MRSDGITHLLHVGVLDALVPVLALLDLPRAGVTTGDLNIVLIASALDRRKLTLLVQRSFLRLKLHCHLLSIQRLSLKAAYSLLHLKTDIWEALVT